MSKKITAVSHEMTYSGAPQSLLNCCLALKNYGCEVNVFTLTDGEFRKEFSEKNIVVEPIPNDYQTNENFIKKLSEYDAVITNTVFTLDFADFSQNIVPTILYLREAENLPQIVADCGLDKAKISQINCVVCVSEYAEKFIAKEYGIKNLYVIHNFIKDEFSKIVLLEKKVKFMVAGTVEKRKGFDIALSAFLRLPPELQEESELHLVGRKPDWSQDYWKKLTTTSRKNVVWHDEITDNNQKLQLFQQMNVFVVPSLDEACSLVALEGAMLGKPVILSENVGAKYIVNNQNGKIVKTGNIDELTAAFSYYIKNKNRFPKFAKAARIAYLKFATGKNYAENLCEIIRKIPPKIIENEEKICVSIVVPVYNAEPFLRQCLDSIIAQRLQNIEIICVNDGSTDSSLEILKSYANSDNRIKILDDKNGGYGHAMNRGIAAANGKYIGIVEPDDYVLPDMFARLFAVAEANRLDFVKSDFYRFKGNGDAINAEYNSTALHQENYGFVFTPLEKTESFRYIMNTWSGIYRRKFLLENNIKHNETSGAAFQDNGFWFQTFCFAKRAMVLREAYYMNRRDNPNSSVLQEDKIFLANNEYKFIKSFIDKHQEFPRKVIYLYSMKRLHTYNFTINRIGWEYKKKYIQKISDEYKEAMKKGEFCQAFFTSNEWTDINRIINDPDEYYYEDVLRRIKVSVILTVYNTEPYLKQCIDSLLNQYLLEFELICVDDGSTDNSPQMLDEYALKDNRVIVYHNKNQGAGNARNFGLSKSNGRYVIFLDSDDFFERGLLSEMYLEAEKRNAEICIAESNLYFENTGVTKRCTYSVSLDRLPAYRPFSINDMNSNPFRYIMGWAWDKLYKRSFIESNKLKFQEQRTTNDMYFVYASLLKASRITTVNVVLINQRRNITNSLSLTRSKSWDCFYKALIKLRSEMMNMGIYNKYRQYFINYALHSCLWNAESLPPEIAVKLMQKLRSDWFFELGIAEKSQSYFEYIDEYERAQELLNCDDFETLAANWHQAYIAKQKLISASEIAEISCENECDTLASQLAFYQKELELTRKSLTYRLGNALLYIPKKLFKSKKETKDV